MGTRSSMFWVGMVVAALACAGWGKAAQWAVGPDGATGLEVVRDGEQVAKVSLSAWGPEYKWFEYAGPAKVEAGGVRALQETAKVSGTTASLAMDYRVRQAGEDRVELAYVLTASDPTEFVGVSCTLTPAKGSAVTATFEDGSADAIDLATNAAVEKRVRRLAVKYAGESYLVELDGPRVLEVFGGDLRVWLAKGSIAGKTPVGTKVTFAFPGKAKFYPRESDGASSDITPDWFAYPVATAGTPVDLSFLNKDGSGKFVPAGAHGFLKVKGEDFVFEDGTPARFWGVNVTAYGAMASYQRSAQLAERIARLGCNVVRLHHLDSEWGPNIIDVQHPSGTTQHLDPIDMKKLDRLVYELKLRGIYVILDPWVGRIIKPGDNVPGSERFKGGNFGLHPYVFFDPRLRELHKKFLKDFWTHVNEFTGLAYKDEPAVATTECANEALFDVPKDMHEPYRSQFLALYRKWEQTTNQTPSGTPESVIALNYPERHQRFYQWVMREFYADIRKYLKDEIGVKVPINDSNWFHWPWEVGSQAGGDFMDAHHYYHGNRIGPTSAMGGLWVQNPLKHGESPFAPIAAMGLLGKPLTVSECGDNPPQTYRASYYLGLAAVAALQGWDGVTPYAYTQSPQAAGKLQNFEMESDPATVASIACGALIYRRGDVRRAEKLAVLLLPADEQYAMHWENGYEKAYDHTPQFRAMIETRRVRVVYGEKLPEGVKEDQTFTPRESFEYKHEGTQILSDTKEVWRDWSLGVGLINTPRTQAAYGFLTKTPISTADVSFGVTSPEFATVAVQSLTDEPMRESKRLLLTAVARAQDSNQASNLSKTKIAVSGRPPVVCEPVVGRVTFATAAKSLTVRPLLPNGVPGQPILVEVNDGKATVELKASHKTLFYDVTAGP